jgi:aromatic-L-amino-acid decarboxylase
VSRTTPLAMSADEFRQLGHALVDQLADAVAAIPDGRITPNAAPATVRSALGLGQSMPEDGTDARDLVLTSASNLFEHSLFNAHPRFFGYITSPPAPIGVFADLIAGSINANVGSWQLSPAATEVELETIRWIAELIGYPTPTGGVLVSGGNMANIVCFFAARAVATPWDVRKRGMAGARRLVAYCSSDTHTWVQKAADLAGLGTDAIRWIPVDGGRRMRVDELTRQIDEDTAKGNVPLMVIATAGSVSTGAVDPLPAIAEVCRARKIWFHVDGAYGGFAAISPDAPDDLSGIASADSVAVDPHKWLYAPLEVGCALVRDPAHLRSAFAYHPPYYHFDEHVTNFVDFGPQNSRGFRALKVWLALRHAGRAGYRQLITEDMRLSRAMAHAIERHPELELVTQALSITTFRFVPERLRHTRGTDATDGYLNRLNERILDRLQRGGELFVSNAVLDGRYVLRACIVNFHTEERDVDAVPEIVVRTGRSVDEALQRESAVGR